MNQKRNRTMNKLKSKKIAMLNECLSAVEAILKWKPQLAAKQFGSTTLGNLRAEISAELKAKYLPGLCLLCWATKCPRCDEELKAMAPLDHQLIHEDAIKWLFDNHEKIWDEFSNRVSGNPKGGVA